MNDNQLKTTCSDWGKESGSKSGLRNNYCEKKHLSVRSFRTEQDYHVSRRHMLNLSIHGSGVVYGFEIKIAKDGLAIGPGLALDSCGRELVYPGGTVTFDNAIALNNGGRPTTLEEQLGKSSECWLLKVHYAERLEGPVSEGGPCEWEQQSWNYTCETVSFSFERAEKKACEPPMADCPEIECESRHEFICEQSKKPILGSERCELTPIDGGCTSVDFENGVPLACFEIEGRPGCREFKNPQTCGPRRFVKTNELLYSLLPGHDKTTRIVDFGWKEWHRSSATLEEFKKAFGKKPDTGRFWLQFSHPVTCESLRPDCFSMRILIYERGDNWLRTYRVPIEQVIAKPDPENEEVAIRATFVADPRWRDSTVERNTSLLENFEVTVEIEFRGDFVLDTHGRAVDADSISAVKAVSKKGKPVSSGNGRPGGTFLSVFKVGEGKPGDQNQYQQQEPVNDD